MSIQHRPNTGVTDTLPRSLLDSYLKHYRNSGNIGIRDRRMKHLQGSAAVYILELAKFSLFEAMSPELAALFTEEELEEHRLLLRPLVIHHREILANGDLLDKDMLTSIKNTARDGLRILIAEVPLICTTSSIATEVAFNMTRQAHAVYLEEAGRGNDSELIGYFSHYWNAKLRMKVGSTNQLPPATYGDPLENPFQTQLTLSMLLRFAATGFDVNNLTYTSRFMNQDLRNAAHI
jgi:hypothetical protein